MQRGLAFVLVWACQRVRKRWPVGPEPKRGPPTRFESVSVADGRLAEERFGGAQLVVVGAAHPFGLEVQSARERRAAEPRRVLGRLLHPAASTWQMWWYRTERVPVYVLSINLSSSFAVLFESSVIYPNPWSALNSFAAGLRCPIDKDLSAVASPHYKISNKICYAATREHSRAMRGLSCSPTQARAQRFGSGSARLRKVLRAGPTAARAPRGARELLGRGRGADERSPESARSASLRPAILPPD